MLRGVSAHAVDELRERGPRCVAPPATGSLPEAAATVNTDSLREWSSLDRAVEAGRLAATHTLETGGAERLRAALDAPV